MDTRELKEILKNSTSVLILEGGEPEFVVLDYETYRRNIAQQRKETEVPITNGGNGHAAGYGEGVMNGAVRRNPKSAASQAELELLEKLNREIMTLRHQIELEEQKIEGGSLRDGAFQGDPGDAPLGI